MSAKSVTVELDQLDLLAPPSLEPGDLKSWISAPIAGEPLHRRMVQRILGLPLPRVSCTDTRLANELRQLLPAYGLSLEPATRGANAHVLLPARGLLEVDLPQLWDSACLLGGTVVVPCLSTSRSEIDDVLTLSATPGAAAASKKHVLQARRLWETKTAEDLYLLAVRALEGELAGLAPAGAWKGELLLGPRAVVHPQAEIHGPSAIGAESRVEADANLKRGTIVGERCFVGRGARLSRAMLLNGARVAPGEQLSGIIRLPSGADLALDSGSAPSLKGRELSAL